MLESVDVGRQSIGDYEACAGREAVERLRSLAEPLKGARVLHLNATPYGGWGRGDPALGGAAPAGSGPGRRLEDHNGRQVLLLAHEDDAQRPAGRRAHAHGT